MTDADFVAWLRTPSARRNVLVHVQGVLADGVPTTVRLSSRGYTSGATAAAWCPAHTWHQPVLTGRLSVSERLSLKGQARTVSGGDVEMDNADGSRDHWLGWVWDGRAIDVYMGDVTWEVGDYRLMYSGVVGRMGSRDRSTLNLPLLDKLDRLNAPLSEALVGGSGPAATSLVPVALGECFNVEPVLVDAGLGEYVFHTGAVEAVVEARYAGDVLDVAPTPLLATGRLRFNNTVAGQVTLSVQGDKPAGVYGSTVGQLVQRIATGFGPAATRFAAGDLDAAQLAAFDAANPQKVGLYVAQSKNQLEAMQELASSVGAQVVTTPQGLLRLVKLELPPPGAPTVLTASDIALQSLHVSEVCDVVAGVKLGYSRNWTVQTQTAPGVVSSARALLAQEWLQVVAKDDAVAAARRLSTDVPLQPTCLLRQTEAQAEADRLLALHSVQRCVYTVDAEPHLLLTSLGQGMTLRDERFGLQAGKTGMVVQIDRDLLSGRSEIGVWA